MVLRLLGSRSRVWLVLSQTRDLMTHLYSSASREFLSRNPSLSKWQFSHFLCLWSNYCQRCYVTLGHLKREVMRLPSCWADDWSTTAVDLGLPAIIFLRPDNLTSRLDPRLMIVLWWWEFYKGRGYLVGEEWFCFVTKSSRKLVYKLQKMSCQNQFLTQVFEPTPSQNV